MEGLDLADWLDAAEPLLRDSFLFLCACLALDMLLGDPPYRLHPIRLLGRLLSAGERFLRAAGLDGRFGGVVLFLLLAAAALGTALIVHAALAFLAWPLAWLWDLYLGYSLLALGDLAAHGRRIARARGGGDLEGARGRGGLLVGRDMDRMDLMACNRAGIESLAENLVDGVIAPLFWFALGGLPGLILFKIASTMDSMVGYRNERYLRFGWFGARLDDVMNWIPVPAGFRCSSRSGGPWLPGLSGRKAWRVGLAQHAPAARPQQGLERDRRGGSPAGAAGGAHLERRVPGHRDLDRRSGGPRRRIGAGHGPDPPPPLWGHRHVSGPGLRPVPAARRVPRHVDLVLDFGSGAIEKIYCWR